MRIMVDRLPVARSLARWHCETCDVSFTFKRALQRHERESATHSRNTDAPVCISSPHECAVCKQTFRREFDLRRHFAEQHADGKKPCSACMKVIRPGIPHKDDSGNVCSGRASKPEVTRVEGEQVISNETRLSYIDEDVSATSSSLCNYCRKSFQNQASEALHRHLNNHLVELTQWHECTTCDVFFQHSRDLELHHQWAEKHGYCGLSFEHQEPCTGHHGPVTGDFESSQVQQQDRHAFCVSLRSWEYTQLKLYRQRVGELLTPQVQVTFATASADKVGRTAERRAPVEYLAAVPASTNDRTVNTDKQKIQRTRTEHRRPADALRKKNSPPPAIPIQDRTPVHEYLASKPAVWSIPLIYGLKLSSAWKGIRLPSESNGEQDYAHDPSIAKNDMQREFLSLIRNLIGLRVAQEHILSALQGVAADPLLLGRLFQWRRDVVASGVESDHRIVYDAADCDALRRICRDLGL